MTTLAQDLFAQARELPAAERDAFLQNACGDDAELHLEVQRLLVDAERAASFFGDADGATLGAEEFQETYAEKEGDVIGPYKLRQAIGEGGFGMVWMAEQSVPISRMVALKVIKAGMDTKQVLARFEAERQALAMMDHPHIAKVLDAGATTTGRPWFAMELVKGIPITDYCDQAGLGTRERLALFRDVCSAINHAHQKGIIHRDIKPSNVMITLYADKPVVKVIDFGIAKATQGKLTDKTLFTRFEQFIGTPVYMSPEQAALSAVDIDTRSDIYALGILLYELLVGKPPFDPKTLVSAGYEEMRRIIREVEPVKPSSRLGTLAGEERTLLAKTRHVEEGKLNKLVEPDLDWVVMKAIEKDRTRRYETANAFAADIMRFLNDEPVTATPPSKGYQFKKFARRHKAAFRIAALVALLLVAGTLVSMWQAVRATKAEKVATSEATRATAALDELRATAPAFAEQARGLAAKEQYADAITKLDYAVKLRPDAAEFLVAKGDLLQCQLQLAPATAVYREALRVQPDHARAEASAKLCDELLAAPPAADGKLSRESLAKLHLAMQQQQRPAAELLPVARLLGEEKKLLLGYWLDRLKDLPVSAEKPLAKRLTVREDGRLALDLSGTKVTDLSPLAGAPLAVLDLNGSTELTDLSPLAGLALIELQLDSTGVTDLTPLREMHSLETLTANETQVADLTPLSALRLKSLYLSGSRVTDLTPLQKMPLEELNLRGTRVTDLSPLSGMPIKSLDLDRTPVRDFSPLARMPLEKCYLVSTQITDLTVLRGRPLKELSLSGCAKARNYAVLAEIPTLETLLLPSTFRSLPDKDLAAIGALRTHPKLRQIQADIEGTMYYSATQSKDLFWQDWDRLQTFLPALHKSGFKFTLNKYPDGTYMLSIQSQPLSDLSFLKGAPISTLLISSCKVADLTPLRGMPLRYLNIFANPITDLSPLRGLPLETLVTGGSSITDLSPLAGMPLKSLRMIHNKAPVDVAPLLEVPTLEEILVPTKSSNIELLRKMPNLKKLDFAFMTDNPESAGSTAADFWKKWEALGWMRALNDSGIPYTASEIGEWARFGYRGTGMWSVRIASKDFRDCSIFKGAANIRELNLAGSAVTDLAPLADCKGLQNLIIPTEVNDIEFLRKSNRLQRISHREDPKTKKPAQTATEFWKDYDTQGWLRALRASGLAIKSAKQLEDGTWDLNIAGAAITDLAILKGAPISRLNLAETAVSDLTPLRGLLLKSLRLDGTKVTDLNPLQEMPLEKLALNRLPIADLTILRGLPLQTLEVYGTRVVDLEPLRGMALSHLRIDATKIIDLTPLKGMPLEELRLNGTPVTDLSALRGMPLTKLTLHNCTKLTDLSPLADSKELTSLTLPPNAKDVEFFRAFPKLERLSFAVDPKITTLPAQTAAEFWKEYDTQGWLRDLRASGLAIRSAKQLEDGTWDLNLDKAAITDLGPLKGAPVSVLRVASTGLADLTPLRGMSLKILFIQYTKVTDLDPLKGMPLEQLRLNGTPVTDLSVLRGMPLTKLTLHNCAKLTDLSPLADSKELTSLTLPPNAKDIEFLRAFPKLERLSFTEDSTPGKFHPAQTAAEFWKEYDAKKQAAGEE